MALVVFILAAILTVAIGKRLFANTIGTPFAYAWRYMLLFIILLFVIAGACTAIGIL